jgi:polyisoprenoid-binding protein YceI
LGASLVAAFAGILATALTGPATIRLLMRALLRTAAVVVVVARAALAAGEAEPYGIDPDKSKAAFSVQHVFVERIAGTLPIISGAVMRVPGSVIPESTAAVLDATELSTDEPERDAWLQSSDFFDTKKYPTWTFASTKMTPHGPAAFGMDGTLTIHGVSQPEHLDVVVRGDAAHLVYHAVAHIDRRAFGMAVPRRLDRTIGEVVDITLDIVLK